MRTERLAWVTAKGWNHKPQLTDANLVVYFGGPGVLDSGQRYQELKAGYPNAHIVGCSTGGEIWGADVTDNSLVVAAVKLDKTPLRAFSTQITDNQDSFLTGSVIAEKLNAPDLSYVLVLSDGTNVNGSDLIRGIYSVLDEKVIVTGGLAGDGADFKRTLVGLDAPPVEKLVAAVGFYGDALRVGYGSAGGWLPFGPLRLITKSSDNVLYELDGRPALDLYKEYLGESAKKLPGSALLFPLSIQPTESSEHETVRTIVGVDEASKSMTFAGDVPEGYRAQLMRGDFNRLVDGAIKAAELATAESSENSLAILVSCIGRKLLMGQSISDETEAVADAFGHRVPTIGFYSYGEICHQQFTGKCSLHNQTMTITTLYET